MNATEERLRDALKTVGDTIGPEDVPEPRFATRRRRLSRPVMAVAAVAASAAVVVGGAVLGGVFPSGDAPGPLAPPSASPSPSGSTAPRISVFLCTKASANQFCEHKDATEPQKRAIQSRLEALAQVSFVEFENTRQARERFERRFESSPELSRILKNGDVPESFRVTLASVGDVGKVMRDMVGRPGVDAVIIERR
ncbi:hypothetical protein E1293_24570 [Actinomadura darangshiensis]|uniref:FtsX extracellular domain-containing protein n=1 Tax=Actinomadura darangshiensis TaxID=705336 RepID=A0A4R5B2T9_9ACTN|nr:permease-like cell division protein FtsX [Actinomadura darangshiensis]TDD79029.1 hypothetical protein E1293_24570 [Actinomadura darangshiensis]